VDLDRLLAAAGAAAEASLACGRHRRLVERGVAAGDGERVRREPEGAVLYRAVQAVWGTFVGGVEARERSVPRFCVREVEAFLRCGALARRHDGGGDDEGSADGAPVRAGSETAEASGDVSWGVGAGV
jgi:hypothetical protein